MKLNIAAAFLVAIMLTPLTPNTWADNIPPLSDVSGADYADDIYWTIEQGITSGYGDGTWGPDDCVTRAQLLKMTLEYLYQGEDIHLVAPNGVFNEFSDVNNNDWFTDYVMLAKSLGVVEGYDDSTFRPNNCVNRVEAMKIALVTLMPYQETSGNAPLSYDDKTIADMSHANWYSKYARTMFEKRIAGTNHTQLVSSNNGVKLINFFPEGDMSRKEVAHMIHNISKVRPGLACRSSDGVFNVKTETCNCDAVDDGFGSYNELYGYCQNAVGEPAGDLTNPYRSQHPLNH